MHHIKSVSVVSNSNKSAARLKRRAVGRKVEVKGASATNKKKNFAKDGIDTVSPQVSVSQFKENFDTKNT